MPDPVSASSADCTRFGQLSIVYDDRVLTPREWTTAQSEWAAQLLTSRPGGRLLELCAGVGHMGLLAVSQSPAPVVLVDINPVACSFAGQNARQVAAPVDVRCGPMDRMIATGETFDVIIADPPWVPSSETARFPSDPLLAIDGGHDGLSLARMCLDVIASCLAPDGTAILQLGSTDQADSITRWLAATRAGLAIEELRSYGTRGVLVSIRPA